MSKGDYLYLATFTRVEKRYMSHDHQRSSQMRLVWANLPDEAEEKLRKQEERDDPYGLSIDLENVELHEAIV